MLRQIIFGCFFSLSVGCMPAHATLMAPENTTMVAGYLNPLNQGIIANPGATLATCIGADVLLGYAFNYLTTYERPYKVRDHRLYPKLTLVFAPLLFVNYYCLSMALICGSKYVWDFVWS